MTEVEKKIGAYLSNENIDCSLNGFRFLREAILFTTQNPTATTGQFCSHVADKYQTNAKKVANSISYALRGKNVRPKQFVHMAAVVISLQELQRD